MKEHIYDVIILGAGPAGLSAGIYAARAKMRTLIIEKGVPGGLIFTTSEVDNYPGSIENATGPDLSERMKRQAESFGAEFVTDEVINVNITEDIKTIEGTMNQYKARSLIIAAGALPKIIGCKGEKEHVGQGVSYCATCDGSFFSGLEVFVVGGGDAAVEEAVFLTRFARKVTIVHRRDKLRAAKSLQDKAFNNDKILFKLNSVIEEIKGEEAVDSIVFKDTVSGKFTEYKADSKDGLIGVFVFIGYTPNTRFLGNAVQTDSSGYIITDDRMATNLEGVFAAGDIRVKPLRQVVTAVSDGAVAAVEAEKYVERMKE